MTRVAILIDGGYLAKVLDSEFGKPKVDFDLLAHEVARLINPNANILRTYYYYSLPYKSNPPTMEESSRFSDSQNFIAALDRLPRFEIRLGRLARRGPDEKGRYSYEQKMVDVLLSVDLVHLAAKGQITDVALIAGDGDFVPAIKIAKDEGVSVWLFHGASPHNELWTVCDERIRISLETINKVRMKSA